MDLGLCYDLLGSRFDPIRSNRSPLPLYPLLGLSRLPQSLRDKRLLRLMQKEMSLLAPSHRLTFLFRFGSSKTLSLNPFWFFFDFQVSNLVVYILDQRMIILLSCTRKVVWTSETTVCHSDSSRPTSPQTRWNFVVVDSFSRGRRGRPSPPQPRRVKGFGTFSRGSVKCLRNSTFHSKGPVRCPIRTTD